MRSPLLLAFMAVLGLLALWCWFDALGYYRLAASTPVPAVVNPEESRTRLAWTINHDHGVVTVDSALHDRVKPGDIVPFRRSTLLSAEFVQPAEVESPYRSRVLLGLVFSVACGIFAAAAAAARMTRRA